MCNICSGSAWRIWKVLDHPLSLTTAKIEVREDPGAPILLGDNSRFVKAMGWNVTSPFEQTLRDMLEYWRAR